MSYRILASACAIALLSACSYQGSAPVSPTQAAHAAYLAGDMAAAERGYAAAITANPHDAAALLGLGEVMQATGRNAAAMTLFQRAQELQSGTIRVWNDGRQDGVTEVATRRLGGMMDRAAPAHAAPAYLPPTPHVVQQPAYALDSEGMVYYADEAATQVVNEQLFETPQAAMIGTTVMPGYEPAPMSYEPAPVAYEPAPMRYDPAPMAYEPAPMIREATPIRYEPAPMSYEPAPVSYEAAPVVHQPALMQYEPAPAPMPMPMEKPMPRHSTTSGDYTIVNGVIEQASAPMRTPVPAPAAVTVGYETMPVHYGTPVDVISSPIPRSTPTEFSAPRGMDIENGIPMITLE